MTVKSQEELAGLRAIGKIVRRALDEMSAAVRSGISTADLDRVGAFVLAECGAQSSPPKVYGFPGTACISVNDEVVHGIPGERKIREGDLVKIDMTAEKDGFVADAAVTIRVGAVSSEAESLARCAETAFRKALTAARAGNRISEIGRSVEKEVRRSGFSVIKELCGHGVGRTIHEAPFVPNHYDPRIAGTLVDGLVITIEPIISSGNGRVYMQSDGWTIRTTDKSLSAHFENTVVITKGEPILITEAVMP